MRRVMTRRGRELEQAVAAIEAGLTGFSASVVSPEYVEGRISKTPREIDVSIRATIEGEPTLIMVECRDRKGKGELDWLEQVSSKKEDVGADRAIVVSAGGFTRGAKVWAEAKGIQLRTIEELSPEEVVSWLGIHEIEVVWPCVDVELEVGVFGDPSLNETPQWRATGRLPRRSCLRLPQERGRSHLLEHGRGA